MRYSIIHIVTTSRLRYQVDKKNTDRLFQSLLLFLPNLYSSSIFSSFHTQKNALITIAVRRTWKEINVFNFVPAIEPSINLPKRKSCYRYFFSPSKTLIFSFPFFAPIDIFGEVVSMHKCCGDRKNQTTSLPTMSRIDVVAVSP